MAFASLGAATAEIEERVFSEFIETAADYGIKTRDSKWIAESFLAQEWTRAANLGGGQALVRGLRRRLPSQFWPILAQLRAEEARLEAGAKSPLLERLTPEAYADGSAGEFRIELRKFGEFPRPAITYSISAGIKRFRGAL